MRSIVWAALVAIMLPAVATAQDRPRLRGERPAAQARQEHRAELEQQVLRQFVAQAGQRLGLDAAQRSRLEQVMQAGAAERRGLARESRELRVELIRAVRTEAEPMATYEQILTRMVALREREQGLERREEAALAEFLDPRQRAQFLMLRMQLNERVRGMRGGPPGEGRGDRPRGPGS